MINKYLKIFISVLLLGLGLLFGYKIYSYQWKCLDFVYAHHPFYAVFAKDLEGEMRKRGYITHCSDILPKTVVYFYQTYDNRPEALPEKNPHDMRVAFFGDCVKNDMDIKHLHQFDILLVVNEFQNGYLSTFNLRTAHFPLMNKKNVAFCRKDYNRDQFDIPFLAQRFDDIIQGMRHEKF